MKINKHFSFFSFKTQAIVTARSLSVGHDRGHRYKTAEMIEVLFGVLTRVDTSRGKSGPALGGTEYRLMPPACRLIVRAKL